MSASPPTADLPDGVAEGPFLTQLGHSRGFESNGSLRPETVIGRGLTECPLVDQKADDRADCCGARYLSVGYAGFGISKRKKLAGSDFVAL